MSDFRHWTEEETDYLLSIMSHTHPLELGIEMRKAAEEYGWHPRSDLAVKTKAIRIAPFTKPIDNNFDMVRLAELLGYNKETIFWWIKREKLSATKVGKYWKITTKAVKHFARLYPSYLKEADPDGLRFLIGDELMELVKNAPRRHGKPRKIKHLKTGIIYDNYRKAAKSQHYSLPTLYRRIRETNEWQPLD